MTKIYEYLQEHCLGNPETKRMLSETPLVHIKDEEIYVNAKQVSIAFDGKKPIPPYLVEIPLQYGRFKELFQYIGTTDSVNLSQYSEVLLRIQAEVKLNMLGPDHIRDVLTALRSIMTLLEEKSLADIEKSMEEVDTLFLPTSEKRLAKSTDLVFVDKPKLRSQVMQNANHGILFMHSLKDCHTQENLILKLPENFKPRVLSSIVQECLLSSSNNTKQDTKVEQLGAFLASSRFLNVIKKIGNFSDEDFEIYRQRLLKIQLVSLSEITTFLMMDDRQIPDTEALQKCFYSVEKSEPKLYFVADDQGVRLWLQDVGQTLFGTLSDCVDNKIAPEKIRELVDYMDYPERFKKYCHELLDEEENEEDEFLAYFPGKLVPLDLHELLENEITLLKVGDLVAYEKFDPLIDGDETDTSTGAVFIFSRIIKILPAASPNDWLQKYEVNFGQGITDTVVGIRLYKVKYPETSTTTELVLHQFGHDGSTPLNRDSIFDEIIDTLSEAWKLDDADRKRIMKRLLLLWHPDNNFGKGSTHQKFCKDVTQFILDVMQRLNEGEQFGTSRFSSTDGRKNRQKEKRDYSDWRYGKCSEKLQAFGDRVSSIHRENHRHFTESYAVKRHYVPNPQPAEAKRWFRQAEMDFKCGVNSLKLNNTTECGCQSMEDYNWICFKFHQACEKACKAYMYCIDERKVTHSHNLRSIISSVAGNEQLAVWIQDVETLVGSYSRMRYPDVMDYPKIPGTSYTEEQATTLKGLTAKIMEEIANKL
ncbi:sacsin-like [Mizuhopecten yessoensis]|uniref:sacsin-like n=1 Tax=Mizuhopecten yessoensis TaxID=6573 RepID=UPI000B4597B8|nr:sacsin-like [Mizuhopecten yessoensis]